jgi:hypothetical protein
MPTARRLADAQDRIGVAWTGMVARPGALQPVAERTLARHLPIAFDEE